MPSASPGSLEKLLFYYFLKKQPSRTSSSSHVLLLLPPKINVGDGAVTKPAGEILLAWADPSASKSGGTQTWWPGHVAANEGFYAPCCLLLLRVCLYRCRLKLRAPPCQAGRGFHEDFPVEALAMGQWEPAGAACLWERRTEKVSVVITVKETQPVVSSRCCHCCFVPVVASAAAMSCHGTDVPGAGGASHAVLRAQHLRLQKNFAPETGGRRPPLFPADSFQEELCCFFFSAFR